jgi:hypothetical protein
MSTTRNAGHPVRSDLLAVGIFVGKVLHSVHTIQFGVSVRIDRHV